MRLVRVLATLLVLAVAASGASFEAPLARIGCALPQEFALRVTVLEGAAGTVLDRTLNGRIRTIAAKYGTTVVDVLIPFAFNANQFVSSDRIHPSGAVYRALETLVETAFRLGA